MYKLCKLHSRRLSALKGRTGSLIRRDPPPLVRGIWLVISHIGSDMLGPDATQGRSGAAQ